MIRLQANAGAVPASRPDPERLRRFGGDTIGLGLAIGIAIGIGTWARGHVSGKLARLRHSGLQNGFLSCHMGESTTAPAPRHPSV